MKITSRGCCNVYSIYEKNIRPNLTRIVAVAFLAMVCYVVYKLCPSRVRKGPPPPPPKKDPPAPPPPVRPSAQTSSVVTPAAAPQPPPPVPPHRGEQVRQKLAASRPAVLKPAKPPFYISSFRAGPGNAAGSIRDYKPKEGSLLNESANPDSKFGNGVRYLHTWIIEFKEGKNTSPHDQMMMDRLTLYDQEIQLGSRLGAIRNEPYYREIWNIDVEAPWHESALRIALLKDSEVADLTFVEIQGMSKRQLLLLNMRISKVKLEPCSDVEDIKGLKLSQLRTISSEVLFRHLSDIPPDMLRLFTEAQLLDLNLQELCEDHFKVVLGDRGRLQKVPAERFVECFERFSRLLPNELNGMTESQVKALNFGEGSCITQEVVSKMAAGGGVLITFLTPKQIMEGFRHFSPATAKYITVNQIPGIDFTKVGDLNAAVITALFDHPRKYPEIQAGSIERLIPLIPPFYLNWLTEQQVRVLDFKNKTALTPAVVESMIERCHPLKRAAGYLVTVLTTEQIVDGLNHGTLTPFAAKFIIAGQMADVDFRKVENFNPDVIRELFHDGKKVPSIPVEFISRFIPHIIITCLEYLTKEQVLVLDFTDENLITKEVVRGMVGEVYNPDVERGRVVPFMSSEQLVHAINRYDKTIYYITDTQLKEMDLELIEKAEIKQLLQKKKAQLLTGL